MNEKILLIAGVMLIVGIFPVFGNILVSNIHPFYALSSSLIISSVIPLGISIFRNRLGGIRKMLTWKYIYISTLLGVVIHTMWFTGLAYTSASNASIISRSEVLFTLIIYGLILRIEKYTPSAIIGGILISIGVGLVIYQQGYTFSTGDLLLLATFSIIPFGNLLIQKAKNFTDSYSIVGVKNILGGIIIMGISLIFLEFPNSSQWKTAAPFIVFQGIFWFFLHKVLWAELIVKMPLAKILSITSLTPLISLVLAYLFLGETISSYHILGFFIVLTGTYLVIFKPYLKGNS